jgi:YidC/Oxa1 family membrane protein insertase
LLNDAMLSTIDQRQNRQASRDLRRSLHDPPNSIGNGGTGQRLMELWHAWTGLLQQILQILGVDWGLGAGLAIILLTLAVRIALAPLTWSLAYRGAVRQAKLARLAPQLKAIRERHANDPRAQTQATMELYRQHGLSLADGKALLGACIQMPVIYGLYQALRNGIGSAPFLWIRNLGRPDLALAIAAALTTMVAMAVAPHMTEQMRVAMLLLPAIFCLLAALHFSSGIALYWITSNLCGTVQTLALRQALRARSNLR